MTIPLYPEFVLAQDLSPDAFGSDIDEVCEEIESATKGFGANKQRVIQALATKNPTERAKISMRYMEMYSSDHPKFRHMADLMKKEFSGYLGDALEFLALPPHQAECAMIRKATKGLGCNVNVVWSIILGRTNEEIELLKKTYFQMYDQDLGKLLASELHGNMERLVFSGLQAFEQPFDPEFHCPEKAREDAELFHSFGQGRRGTNEKGIFKMLASAPPQHIANFNQAYTDKYGLTLWKATEKEMGGSVQQATLYMIGMKEKPFEAMAKLIKQACKGFGTDELLLTCCLIRFQPHMGAIYAAHIELFGKTIHERIRSETGGKYQALLLTILNAVWPEYL